MFKQLLCLGLFCFFNLYCHLATANLPNKISLHDFLNNYFNENESPKNLNLDLKTSAAQRDKVDNQYSAILSFRPEQRSQKDNLVNQSWDREKTISVDYQQNLASGTLLRAGAKKWLENSTVTSFFEYDRTIDNNYYIRLEQSLWRNGLGYNQRSNTRLAKAKYKSQALNNAIEQAKLCSDAIDLYLDTLKSQAQLQISEKIFKNSLKVLKSIKRSHRAKLVRNIELLTAQSDHLNNEQKLAASKISFNLQKTQLATAIKRPVDSIEELHTPNLNSSSKALVTSSQLSPKYKEAFDENIESLKWTFKSQSNLAKPELTFYAEASKNDNQFVIPNGLENAESTTIGLSIDIPINDKSLKANRQESHYQWKKAENERNLQLRSLANDLENSLKQDKLLKQQLDVVAKQKKLQQKQTKEAFKLLKSGQIELRDYIQYRDFELNSELNWIDLVQSYLKNKVRVSLLIHPDINSCKASQL